MSNFDWYGGSGDLGDPANWSQPDPNNPTVPGPNDVVVVGGSGVLTGTGSYDSFDLTAGPMTLDGSVTAQTADISGAFSVGGELTTNVLSVAGGGGPATVSLTAGATVNATVVYLGVATESSGEMTVEGQGSLLDDSGDLFVGSSGTASLQIQEGGRVSVGGFADVDGPDGQGGQVTISGEGSEFASVGVFEIVEGAVTVTDGAEFDVVTLYVGGSGSGTLSLASGGTVDGALVVIGASVAGSGAVTIEGDETSIDLTSELDVGAAGSGSLQILDGGEVSVANFVSLADGPGSGQLSVSGANSLLDVSSAGTRVDLGDESTGQGTLSVTDSGAATISDLYVGYTGTGVVSIETDGVITADTVHVGYVSGSNGSIAVGGGGTLNVVGNLEFGDDGIGTLSVTAMGAVDAANIYIGVASEGSVSVSGAVASLDDTGMLIVGLSGDGTLTVEDGATLSVSSIFVAELAGSTGDLTLDGGADYAVSIGAGTATVTIDGDGSSQIIGGSGEGSVSLTGTGTNTFVSGSGDYVITADGGGTLTINADFAGGQVVLEDGSQLDATGSFASKLAFDNAAGFYVDAQDGLVVGPQAAAGSTPSVSLGLASAGVGVVTIDNSSVSYSNDGLTVSGQVYAPLGDQPILLFDGSFVLPLSGDTTTSLTDSDPMSGDFELGGLDVTFNQLTLEDDALLAGFSITLPFTAGDITIDTSDRGGANLGLSFGEDGVQLLFGASASVPDLGPVDVFGLFQGSLSNISLSYIAASDTLELQGEFDATQILQSSISADVNFTGSNFIAFQDGEAQFVGTLTISGLSTPSVGGKAGFGINSVSLTVDTVQQTLSGSVDFSFPFGGRAPDADVTIKGSWANGPTVQEVDVSASNLGVVIPDTPDIVWQSASVGIADMFDDSRPTTFSGSLGFSLGQTIGGQALGSLVLSGSGSSQQLTGSETLQLAPYSFVQALVGNSLSSLQGLFPVLSNTGTITANFAPDGSGFQSLSFAGTTSILGGFITTSQQFHTDANLDFTLAGSAMVDFGNGFFSKIASLDVTASANFLVSFTDNAPASADFAEAWTTITLGFGAASINTTLGLKVTFAGAVSKVFGASSLANPPSSDRIAGASSADSAPANVLFLTATWTNAASGPIDLSVTTPTGAVVDQSAFTANNMALAPQLTTPFSETVAILNPSSTSGWSVSVTSGSDLGAVALSAAVPDAGPSLAAARLGGVTAAGEAKIDYDVSGVGAGATISAYADQDGQHFDGVLLGQTVLSANGAGEIDTALGALTSGQWHVYVLVSDGAAPPQEAYAAGLLQVGATGAASVTGGADTRDFNGDGASDILFGQSNGTLAEWEMGGTAITGGGNIGGPGGTWAEVGTGDFNGDGTADVLFQDGSGNLAIWEMSGTSIIGGGDVGNPGGTWAEKAVGDFNGDGMADILFQDASGNLAIWEMNGTSIVGGGAIGNPGGTWAEKAVGDFNGDGKSDILFQDAAGDLAIWEMNGTSIIGGGDIGNPGPGWTVEGTGDFNGDGMSDILFENTSGEYAIWEMNGTSIIGGGDIGDPGGTWQFAGIGDYNGDGHADILFTDAAGDLSIWEMNGTQIIGGGQIGNPGSIWHVLG